MSLIQRILVEPFQRLSEFTSAFSSAFGSSWNAWITPDVVSDGNRRPLYTGGYGIFDGIIVLTFSDLTGIDVASSTGTWTPVKSGNTITSVAGNAYTLVLDNGSHYDFSFHGSGATIPDLSDNGLDAEHDGDTATFWAESIDVDTETSRNRAGYNLAGSTYIPRLDTDANKALPYDEQLDILGNVLENYGTAPLDGTAKSGTVTANGTDNILPTGISLISTSKVEIVGRYVANTDGDYQGQQSSITNFYIGCNGTKWALRWGNSATTPSVAVSDTEVHTFVIQGGVLTIDGVTTIDVSATAVYTDDPTALFNIGALKTLNHSNFEYHTVKVWLDGVTLTASYQFGETDGVIAYDTSGNGNNGEWAGDIGSLHTTSEFQRPNDNIDGCDYWTNDSTSAVLRVPFVTGTNTSIKTDGDTITGYSWDAKVIGDDTAWNGSETTITQPANCPALWAADQLFDTPVMYDASDDPNDLDPATFVDDYEDAGLFLVRDVGGLKSNMRVYDEPHAVCSVGSLRCGLEIQL